MRTYRDNKAEELEESLRKWLASDSSEQVQVSWACKYLRRHPLEGVTSPLLSDTAEALIQHVCAAPVSFINQDRIRKMRGSWRVAKLKFNNKLASHTFMLSHDAEWILNKRSKSIARSRNGQGPKSMVIEDLLIEEKDINKKIKSEITKAKKDAVEKINNLKTTLDSISYKLKEKEEKIAEEERNNEILISTIEEINHLIMEVITHPNKALEDFEQNYEDGFTHILEKLPDNIKKKINKLKLF